ncbi:MAG TPA: cytochrome c family protein [Ignavibacteriaceae bacterium]
MFRISLLVISLFAFTSIYAQHSFIGAEACGMCHKTEKQGQQLSIWQATKHAQAYQTLKTEKADQIALEKGFKTKAVETPECLKCHVSGFNVDASLLDKKFKIEDGVQCETCHGAGSDYKSMKVMKSREESVANGMVVFENKEEFCIGCHNAESPTYVDFNFAEMWEKIKHLIPESKE